MLAMPLALPSSVLSSNKFDSRWRIVTLAEGTDTPKNPFISHLQSLKTQWASSQVEIPDDWVVSDIEIG